MSIIRAPRLEELETLRDIERAAGALFADIGLAAVAADDPDTVEMLTEYLYASRIWLITSNNDTPVGYGYVEVLDDLAHLEQLSVRPEAGRRGVGTRLLEHICAWAAHERYQAMTLTTFRDVPWNAPFYAMHGFRILAEAEAGPQLRLRRTREAEHGLDPERRVCMRRDF